MAHNPDGLTPLPTIFDPDALADAEAKTDHPDIAPLPESFEPIAADVTAPSAAEPVREPTADVTMGEETEEEEPVEVMEAGLVSTGAPEHAIEAITDTVEAQEAQGPVVEEVQDEEMHGTEDEDRPEVNQDLMGILRSLREVGDEADGVEADGVGEEGNAVGETHAEGMDIDDDAERLETALSSPLSDLPDLPTEFPPSPEPPEPVESPKSPTPPPFVAKPPSPQPPPPAPSSRGPSMPRPVRSTGSEGDKRLRTGPSPQQPSPSLPGESSSSAAKRSASPVSPPAVAPAPNPAKKARPPSRPKPKAKQNGKAKSNSIPVSDSEDDLCSVNGEHEPPLKSLSEVKGERGQSEERRSAGDKRKQRAAMVEGGPKKKKKLDPISFQPRTTEPPEKIVPRAQVLNHNQIHSFLKGKTKEVQLAPCLRPRYAKWGKCTQCVSKIGGDSCRFRDYRVFPIDPVTTEITGPGTFESTEWKEKMTPLPREFNKPLTEEHMKRIERTVAPLLLPLITRELRHVVRNEAIKRGTDAAKHRAVCDFCSSTIFGGWWFCKKCGRDYCLVCERYFADTADKMEESPWHLPPAARPRLLRCIPNATATAVPASSGRGRMKSRSALNGKSPSIEDSASKEKGVAGTTQAVAESGKGMEKEAVPPTLAEAGDVGDSPAPAPSATVTNDANGQASEKASTTRDRGSTPSERDAEQASTRTEQAPGGPTLPRGKAFHFRPDLQPVSRFSETDLRNHWLSLAEFVLHSEGNVGDRLKLLGLSTADDQTIEQMQDWLAKLSTPKTSGDQALTAEQVDKLYTKHTHSTARIEDPAGLEERSLAFMFIDNNDLTLEVFDQLWARGEPIVVDHVGDGLKLSWTPDDFIEKFGKEICVVVDCQSDKPLPRTVKQFFETFKDRENRSKAVLKLKDWPQTTDFKDTHPDLYNDFSDALPVPDFTRREGVLNLYAHFPPGPTRPDIGPKMYNAFEAIETPGGKGSTRLHMDVADAVNVMLYASDRADGQPGCAVWDLFRAQDADKIRSYLRGRYDKTHTFTDPIHSQLFYLDSKARKELAEKFGVVSWRVYQYPGQAVFIPAGCAHQVCNLADCIKIALDFVSTHNVSRCQQLTQDFRTENFVKAWKEDVLQLYNVLWYAWTNVGETRRRRREEARAAEEEQKQRMARVAQLQAGEHESPTAAPPPPYGSSAYAASPYGIRGPGTGMFGAAVSSVRDEENTRSPSLAHSRGSSPARGSDLASANVEAEASDTQGETSSGDAQRGGEEDANGDSEKTKEADHRDQIETVSPTRNFAEKLLTATLLASEPAPPPEARAPSTASKWGLNAARFAHSASPAGTPKGKTTPGAISRSLRTGHVPVKRESGNGDGAGAGDRGMDERPKRVPTSQLIQMGVLPIDLAVSAARLQMGEGADEDEGEVGEVGEVGGTIEVAAEEAGKRVGDGDKGAGGDGGEGAGGDGEGLEREAGREGEAEDADKDRREVISLASALAAQGEEEGGQDGAERQGEGEGQGQGAREGESGEDGADSGVQREEGV